ncbi:MAG: hypothetical protein AABY07_00130 [Nanoarchaeota archaeon]
MILGNFYQGSGLGNQLARLVATRVKALDLGVDWGMIYIPDGSGKEQGFKGQSFMDIGWDNFGATPYYTLTQWNEKKVRENGVDISPYDPEFNFIEDNTIIDGEFQDERYWEHREKEVNEWLKVEPLDMPDDLCVIGFRGGEFAVYPDLFLPKEYWDEGIKRMRDINPNMRFEVHTDDEILAQQCFPDFKVIHDIGINWRSMRYAKYAIISNSSFFILPRWLNKGITIAPRYWGRHNTKVWSLPQNYYSRFLYI